MQEIVACTAALGIGLSLGLIGAGGSILTIPVFVYVLKIDPLSSSIYSMFVVGISSLAGGIQSIINKLVDWNTTILFGVPSIVGVFVARKFLFPAIPVHLFSIGSFVVSKEMLFMLCLASLMLFAATRMLKPMQNQDESIKPKTGDRLAFDPWRDGRYYYRVARRGWGIFNCTGFTFLGVFACKKINWYSTHHYLQQLFFLVFVIVIHRCRLIGYC